MTDQYANTAKCKATVTIVDAETPTIRCPSPMLKVLADAGTSTRTFALPMATVSDNIPDMVYQPNAFSITRQQVAGITGEVFPGRPTLGQNPSGANAEQV